MLTPIFTERSTFLKSFICASLGSLVLYWFLFKPPSIPSEIITLVGPIAVVEADHNHISGTCEKDIDSLEGPISALSNKGWDVYRIDLVGEKKQGDCSWSWGLHKEGVFIFIEPSHDRRNKTKIEVRPER